MCGSLRTDDFRSEVIATRVGCIVCRLEHEVFSAPHVHHMNEGMGRRVWWQTYGLCPFHHTAGGYGNAIHAGRAEFERKHGTEVWLLQKTNEVLKQLLTDDEYRLATSPSEE